MRMVDSRWRISLVPARADRRTRVATHAWVAQVGTGREPPGATLPNGEVVGQTIYVPIASSVATADNARPINLAATVTIRNLDQVAPIEIRSARYHDSGGRLIRASSTNRSRSGRWRRSTCLSARAITAAAHPRASSSSGSPVDDVAPLVEAVMISTAGSQGLMLRSDGTGDRQQHR